VSRWAVAAVAVERPGPVLHRPVRRGVSGEFQISCGVPVAWERTLDPTGPIVVGGIRRV